MCSLEPGLAARLRRPAGVEMVADFRSGERVIVECQLVETAAEGAALVQIRRIGHASAHDDLAEEWSLAGVLKAPRRQDAVHVQFGRGPPLLSDEVVPPARHVGLRRIDVGDLERIQGRSQQEPHGARLVKRLRLSGRELDEQGVEVTVLLTQRNEPGWRQQPHQRGVPARAGEEPELDRMAGCLTQFPDRLAFEARLTMSSGQDEVAVTAGVALGESRSDRDQGQSTGNLVGESAVLQRA